MKDINNSSSETRMRPTGIPSSAYSGAEFTRNVKSGSELKIEHAVVLRTLTAANVASRRVVTTLEIVQALSEREAAQIVSAYQQSLTTVIGKILTLLQARGLVFSPGKSGNNRYYGATTVFPSKDATLPDRQTRRGRVLSLTRGAVDHFGRSVRIGDILKYAEGRAEVCDLDASTISHDVLSLAHTDDLRVVGVVRGEDTGNNLYLPPDLEPALYLPKEPLTWLEEVARAFNEVWADNLKEAREKDRLPRPVSTGEVRARWVTSANAHPKSREKQPVVNAMGMLAKNSRKQPPLVRKIRRKGEKAILWAPIDFPDAQLDIGDAHASDAERVGMAVQRAAEQLGRPVTVRDVADEIELDPSLRPASSVSLHKLLSDVSKETVAVGKGRRKKRVSRRVCRVGTVDNTTYYYCAEGLDEARAYVELRRIESRWQAVQAEDQLENLKGCLIPSLIVGRTRLIDIEAQGFCQSLNGLLSQRMDHVSQREAEEMLRSINEVVDKARKLIAPIAFHRSLPESVSTDTPGWTAAELFSAFYSLLPNIKGYKDHNDLNSLFQREIRRVPNPDFKHRFSKEPRGASEFVYDRADALFYTAKRWGGYECRFQAKTARDELGLLRDVRYVFPALRAEDMRVRLAGVASLAFLWSAEGYKYLRRLAVEDPEPGVRQSAMWAYGFAGGEGAVELARETYEQDRNSHVRTFAEKVLQMPDKAWWAL